MAVGWVSLKRHKETENDIKVMSAETLLQSAIKLYGFVPHLTLEVGQSCQIFNCALSKRFSKLSPRPDITGIPSQSNYAMDVVHCSHSRSHKRSQTGIRSMSRKLNLARY